VIRQSQKLANSIKGLRARGSLSQQKGSVHLSDGEVNLAILNAIDPEDPDDLKHRGMYHFGFHVDDQETVAKGIQEIYPQGAPESGLTAPVTLKPEGQRPKQP
jgi:catechol-2,3-dioxygenase